MKRMSYNVALGAILSKIRGDQKIRVNDYERIDRYASYETIYDGECMNVYKSFPKNNISEYMLEKTKVNGITLDGNVIVFDICTNCEEY